LNVGMLAFRKEKLTRRGSFWPRRGAAGSVVTRKEFTVLKAREKGKLSLAGEKNIDNASEKVREKDVFASRKKSRDPWERNPRLQEKEGPGSETCILKY